MIDNNKKYNQMNYNSIFNTIKRETSYGRNPTLGAAHM